MVARHAGACISKVSAYIEDEASLISRSDKSVPDDTSIAENRDSRSKLHAICPQVRLGGAEKNVYTR